MSYYYKKTLTLLLLIFGFQSITSQTSNSNSISVIISPGTDNPQTISNVGIRLKSFPGVLYKGYCSSHNVYFIVIDKNSYTTAQLFYVNFKSITNINSLLLKEGNQNDILPFCESKIPETIQEIEAKKSLLDK